MKKLLRSALKTKSLIFSLTFAVLGSFSFAQTVEKINGKSVLLNTGGQVLTAGSDWLTISDTKKKTGWIKIKQVRGEKAVAEIMSGEVFVGQTLIPKPPPVSRFAEDPDVIPIDQVKANAPSKVMGGVLFGYASDTMSFTAGDSNNPPIYTENATLTGTTYTIKGYYDSQYNDKLTIRYTCGLDGFSGTYKAQNSQINKQGSGTGSNVSVSTIAIEAEALWIPYKNKSVKLWAGGGYSFQYNTGTSTNMNSLTMSSSYSNILLGGLGADIVITPKYTMPVFYNYNYYLAGKGITQNATTLGIGIGWPM